jgi:hypothetical protein
MDAGLSPLETKPRGKITLVRILSALFIGWRGRSAFAAERPRTAGQRNGGLCPAASVENAARSRGMFILGTEWSRVHFSNLCLTYIAHKSGCARRNDCLLGQSGY